MPALHTPTTDLDRSILAGLALIGDDCSLPEGPLQPHRPAALVPVQVPVVIHGITHHVTVQRVVNGSALAAAAHGRIPNTRIVL
jgi:hypothetical protein